MFITVCTSNTPNICPAAIMRQNRRHVMIKLSIMIGVHAINWAMSWENLFMTYANNKGADQSAHLPVCTLLFAAWIVLYLYFLYLKFKACSWAGRFESYLVENPKDRFSHDKAQLLSTVMKDRWICPTLNSIGHAFGSSKICTRFRVLQGELRIDLYMLSGPPRRTQDRFVHAFGSSKENSG